jgi:hypothetical protein
MFIPDPDFSIPDTGSSGQKSTGSRIRNFITYAGTDHNKKEVS